MLKSKFEKSLPTPVFELSFDHHLFDKESTPFNFKVDGCFIHVPTHTLTYVEYKVRECNSITCVRTSYNALKHACERHNLPTSGTWSALSHRLYQRNRDACLAGSWSNSLYKQKLVNEHFMQEGRSFILVFKTHSLEKLKYRNQYWSLSDYYKLRHNITAMTLADFEEAVKQREYIALL